MYNNYATAVQILAQEQGWKFQARQTQGRIPVIQTHGVMQHLIPLKLITF